MRYLRDRIGILMHGRGAFVELLVALVPLILENSVLLMEIRVKRHAPRMVLVRGKQLLGIRV